MEQKIPTPPPPPSPPNMTELLTIGLQLDMIELPYLNTEALHQHRPVSSLGSSYMYASKQAQCSNHKGMMVWSFGFTIQRHFTSLSPCIWSPSWLDGSSPCSWRSHAPSLYRDHRCQGLGTRERKSKTFFRSIGTSFFRIQSPCVLLLDPFSLHPPHHSLFLFISLLPPSIHTQYYFTYRTWCCRETLHAFVLGPMCRGTPREGDKNTPWTVMQNSCTKYHFRGRIAYKNMPQITFMMKKLISLHRHRHRHKYMYITEHTCTITWMPVRHPPLYPLNTMGENLHIVQRTGTHKVQYQEDT